MVIFASRLADRELSLLALKAMIDWDRLDVGALVFVPARTGCNSLFAR